MFMPGVTKSERDGAVRRRVGDAFGIPQRSEVATGGLQIVETIGLATRMMEPDRSPRPRGPASSERGRPHHQVSWLSRPEAGAAMLLHGMSACVLRLHVAKNTSAMTRCLRGT